MNKILGAVSFKTIFCTLAVAFCFLGNSVFASDNVLQAIQVNGVKDSYNIILKSDDVADLQKTVQAPNKMILTLKGIRASKTINTIYNNTSSVDSVVVEPIGDDSVKISVQAANVGNAEVHFDSLKTPLGVLGNSEKPNKPSDEIILNDPMSAYSPVYDNGNDENGDFDLAEASGTFLAGVRNVLKDQKNNWVVTLGLFALLLMLGMKFIKNKDNDIKVGLSQSLKEREIALYRNGLNPDFGLNQEMPVSSIPSPQNITGSNYGLRAYQQGSRSPYVSSEIQRPRPAVTPKAPVANTQFKASNIKTGQGLIQSSSNSNQAVAQRVAAPATKPKTTNIDSMKFLESMTKIYEKNGRTDLAQGLKTKMKKAKMNLT